MSSSLMPSKYQAEVERKLDAKMPKFHRNYWWNAAEQYEGPDEANAARIWPVARR